MLSQIITGLVTILSGILTIVVAVIEIRKKFKYGLLFILGITFLASIVAYFAYTPDKSSDISNKPNGNTIDSVKTNDLPDTTTPKISQTVSKVDTVEAEDIKIKNKPTEEEQYNTALASSEEISGILKKLKSNQIPESDKNKITKECRANLVTLETYYKKSHNCRVGGVLREFLQHIVSINQSNIDSANYQRFTEFKGLIADIDLNCGK